MTLHKIHNSSAGVWNIITTWYTNIHIDLLNFEREYHYSRLQSRQNNNFIIYVLCILYTV